MNLKSDKQCRSVLREDEQHFHPTAALCLSAVSIHLGLCVRAGIRLIVVPRQETPSPEQSEALGGFSGKGVHLFLRVGTDWTDNVSVAPVLVMQIRKQF